MTNKIEEIKLGQQCYSLSKFFDNFHYEIPGYQRDYAWEKDNFEDLIDDIQEGSKRRSQHFFGVIMTMEKVDKSDTLLVIDGQQRITTTLVYLKAIYHVIKKNNLDDQNLTSCNTLMSSVSKICYGQTFFEERCENQRLKISGHNQILFDMIMNPNISKDDIDDWYSRKSSNERPETSTKLYNAFSFFFKHFDLIREKNSCEDFYKIVLEEIKFFMNNFKVLVIPIQSQIFAYQFFQTVNDRGKNLVVSDIIKAYFHELCRGNYESEQKVEQLWNRLVENLGNSPTDTFLRHYWLSKEKVIKVTDLLTEIRRRIDRVENAQNFLQALEEESENYKTLLNYETNQKELNAELQEVFLLARNFVMPPILAAYKKFKGKKLLLFVRIITVFVFRYRTICHMENKTMERTLSQIAVRIRTDGNKLKLSQIITDLRKIDIPDDQFKVTFSSFKSRSNALSKYILEKIEFSMRGGKKGKTAWDSKMSVEHILPKKYETNWSTYLFDSGFDADSFIHRLGNLTLLTNALNSGLKNSFFDQKVKEIKKHDSYYINKFIIKQKEWNDITINKRQEQFAEIANKIWNLNKF